MSIKLQIVSDLHLEFRPDNLKFIIPRAPILCLLGDICVCGTDEDFKTFVKFIAEISPQFKSIIHVPGNHEYYIQGKPSDKTSKNTITSINAKFRKVAKQFPNYIPMFNGLIKIRVGKKIIMIIGSTLWTYVPPKEEMRIQSIMNDYACIYVNDNSNEKNIRRFRVSDMVHLHKKSVAFIKKCLVYASSTNIKCVLLTHHKPIWDEADNKSEFGHSYSSDLNDLIKEPLCLVAYGHTHKADRRKVNGVLVVSNPRGYPSERTRFDPECVVTIKL